MKSKFGVVCATDSCATDSCAIDSCAESLLWVCSTTDTHFKN